MKKADSYLIFLLGLAMVYIPLVWLSIYYDWELAFAVPVFAIPIGFMLIIMSVVDTVLKSGKQNNEP